MNATQLTMTDELALLEDKIRAGDSTRRTVSRLARLKREQERTSLGALARVFEDFEFRDGALFRARLRGRSKLASLLAEPAWATLQVLDLGWNELDELDAGAFFNACPALHTVLGLSRHVEHTHPCPRIHTLEASNAFSVETIAAGFPALRSLSMDVVSDVAAFWSHPFVQQLESVRLGALTWSKGTLRMDRGVGGVDAEWVHFGPALRRAEFPEDEILAWHDAYELRPVLAAVRARGAEVVLMPS